jgi:hypothetical protein
MRVPTKKHCQAGVHCDHHRSIDSNARRSAIEAAMQIATTTPPY